MSLKPKAKEIFDSITNGLNDMDDAARGVYDTLTAYIDACRLENIMLPSAVAWREDKTIRPKTGYNVQMGIQAGILGPMSVLTTLQIRNEGQVMFFRNYKYGHSWDQQGAPDHVLDIAQNPHDTTRQIIMVLKRLHPDFGSFFSHVQEQQRNAATVKAA